MSFERAAQGKAEELRGAVENAKCQAKSWQAEGAAMPDLTNIATGR